MFSVLAFNFVLSLTGVIMMLAALNDARSFKIPNWTVLALIALFPFYAILSPTPIHWERNLLVFLAAFGIGYIGYLKNLAGAGDIKLLTAVSLWAGTSYAVEFLFITAIAGGVLAIGIVSVNYVRRRIKKQEDAALLSHTPIPYGIAIALGGLCTLAHLSHPYLLSGKV